ncbi:Orphan sodium- and chloride-dependent neurotransmitter transporter NTT73 [Pteropus alecto]|uniref:Orphan sodium-and chloride-dependent neurotransmitter transporter NTT73 n=1 Tax=Pteropus alecto TaxID=9402 RepID=L5JTA1_PTEAL|nr:Orphan sodium- and chloride-dependent neurotransmitter transporter NTT73 [Pteropus alecto]
MPKNSKVVKRELDDEVIESVKDLLSNEDSADDAFKKSELIVDVQEEKDTDAEEGSEVEDERPAWKNKMQYILAQVGFSVGLGNVWRFPYTCQKNGGVVEPECEKSSATTYYWYREALNISSSISENGGLNWKMTVCLLAAWVMVCLAMFKGIQSSGKIMYFSSLFPYMVLICFLIRAFLLDGSIDGIHHMFTPKNQDLKLTVELMFLPMFDMAPSKGDFNTMLEIMLEPKIWREAATQVFFALSLGFGGVIAFSSFNKRDNNCHFDAVLVCFVNFFTSILATLVVFAVLGFKANVVNEKCIAENSKMIVTFLKMGNISQDIIPHHINFSAVTAEDYHLVYDIIQKVKEEEFPALHLNSCQIEDELNKVMMFFLMLVNLGLGSMFGNIEGIITPIVDTFKVRKEIFTVIYCLVAFCIGLIFVQRSGNYFVTMFDDYSASLPLLIVVILENIAVSFVYGIDKFMEDLRDMLGFAPNRYYYYMWKYMSPLMLLSLLISSVVNMGLSPPGYNAWIEDKASEEFLSYPTWGMVVCFSLVVLAILPIPVVFIIRRCNLIDDSSGNLASVTYKRGRVLKEPVNLEGDDASLIHGKISSEMSSPNFGKNIYRKQSGSPSLDTAPNGRYGIGYLMADMPDMPDMPESDL